MQRASIEYMYMALGHCVEKLFEVQYFTHDFLTLLIL